MIKIEAVPELEDDPNNPWRLDVERNIIWRYSSDYMEGRVESPSDEATEQRWKDRDDRVASLLSDEVTESPNAFDNSREELEAVYPTQCTCYVCKSDYRLND